MSNDRNGVRASGKSIERRKRRFLSSAALETLEPRRHAGSTWQPGLGMYVGAGNAFGGNAFGQQQRRGLVTIATPPAAAVRQPRAATSDAQASAASNLGPGLRLVERPISSFDARYSGSDNILDDILDDRKEKDPDQGGGGGGGGAASGSAPAPVRIAVGSGRARTSPGSSLPARQTRDLPDAISVPPQGDPRQPKGRSPKNIHSPGLPPAGGDVGTGLNELTYTSGLADGQELSPAVSGTWAASGTNAVWLGQVVAGAAGTYRFSVALTAATASLVIDGAALNSSGSDVYFGDGSRHDISVSIATTGSGASASLQWQTPGSSTSVAVPTASLFPYGDGAGTGLAATYYSSTGLAGTASASTNQRIDFTTAPASSAVWVGEVQPYSDGQYTFSFSGSTPPAGRVWVNGELAYDSSGTGTSTKYAVPLRAGERYDIRAEYLSGAAPRLTWSSAQQPTEVVPTAQLYPTTGIVVAATGPTTGGADGSYTLTVSATGSAASTIDHWTVDWGDGLTQRYPAGTTTAQHQFANRDAAYEIVASAFLPDGSSKSASPILDAAVHGASITVPSGWVTLATKQISNGSIGVAGAVVSGSSSTLTIMRLTSDGSLDTSFGTGGMVTATFDGTIDAAAFTDDLSCYVLGDHETSTSAITRKLALELRLYSSAGSIVSSFATSGVYTNTFSTGTSSAGTWLLALGWDGSSYLPILAGGVQPRFAGVANNATVVRLNSNASTASITTLSNAGRVIDGFELGVPGSTKVVALAAAGTSVALVVDGNTLVWGSPSNTYASSYFAGAISAVATQQTSGGAWQVVTAGVSGGNMLFQHVSASFAVDAGFGISGTASGGTSGVSSVTSVQALPDGRLFAVGTTRGSGSQGAAALVRMTADGFSDSTWGSRGAAFSAFGANTSAAALSDASVILASAQAGGLVVSKYRPMNSIPVQERTPWPGASMSAAAAGSTSVAIGYASDAGVGLALEEMGPGDLNYRTVAGFAADGTGGAHSFTVGGLLANSHYEFRLRAIASDGIARYVTAFADTPAASQALASPSNVAQGTTDASGQTTIGFSWDHTADVNASSSFQVTLRSYSSSDPAALFGLGQAAQTQTYTFASSQYSSGGNYAIQHAFPAFYDQAMIQVSDGASVSAWVPLSLTGIQAPPQEASVSMTVTGNPDGSVGLAFASPFAGSVYGITDVGGVTQVASGSHVGSITVSSSSLPSNVLGLVAFDGANYSVVSAVPARTVAPPAAPAHLMVVPLPVTGTPPTPGNILVAWGNSSNLEASYTVQRLDDSAASPAWVTVATLASDHTSFVDVTPSSEGSYQYRVKASNAGADSAWATVGLTIDGTTSVDQGATYPLGLPTVLPDGVAIAGWNIDWGDGSDPDGDGAVGQAVAGNPSAVSHVYDSAGGVTIAATASGEDGSRSTATLDVSVRPSLVISGPDVATAGDDLTYTLDGSGAASAIWTVTRDGSPVTSASGVALGFEPDQAGTYEVDADTIFEGQVLSASRTVVVSQAAFSISISGPTFLFDGRSGVFSSVVSTPSGVDVGDLQYLWQIGDAAGNVIRFGGDGPAMYTGTLPTYLVAAGLHANSTYTMLLTVTGGNATASAQAKFQVLPDPGEANYQKGFGSLNTSGSGISTEQQVNSVVEQADGKVLVAGRVKGLPGIIENYATGYVARFNKDLTPDTSFGDDGIVLDALGGEYGQYDDGAIFAMAIDPVTQNIVVAGSVHAAGRDSATAVVVARYTADGKLDPSFNGGDPFMMTPPGWGTWTAPYWTAPQNPPTVEWSGAPSDVTILPDESIVVGGSQTKIWPDQPGINFSGGSLTDFLLFKLVGTGALAGQPDVAFGNGGVARTINPMGITGYPTFDQISGLDGNVWGYLWSNYGWSTANIAKILPEYDSEGNVTDLLIGGSAWDWANMATAGGVDSVYSGHAMNFVLAKYDPTTGALDTSFGTDGKVMTNFPGQTVGEQQISDDYLSNMEVLTSGPHAGDILAVGGAPSTERIGNHSTTWDDQGFEVPPSLAMAWYLPDGTLDTSAGLAFSSSPSGSVHVDTAEGAARSGEFVTSYDVFEMGDFHSQRGGLIAVAFDPTTQEVILSGPNSTSTHITNVDQDDGGTGWGLSEFKVDGEPNATYADDPADQSNHLRYLDIRDTGFGALGDGSVALSEPDPKAITPLGQFIYWIAPSSDNAAILATADGVIAGGSVSVNFVDRLGAGATAMIVRYKSEIATPSNLQANGVGKKSISLTWTPPVTGTWTAYEIDRASVLPDGTVGSYSTIGYADQSATSYLDSGGALRPGQSYSYEVHAIYGLGTANTYAGPAEASTWPDLSNYALVDTVVVPADGTIVRSGTQLLSGVKYLLRVSGILYAIGPNGDRLAVDAEYVNDTLTGTSTSVQTTSAGPVDVGVAYGGPGTVHWVQDGYSVSEGVGTATFTVIRTGGLAGSLTFHYATTNASGGGISAVAGTDYTASSGNVTLAEGVSSAVISVAITQHTDIESDKVFAIQLTPVGSGTVIDQTTVTIKNNVEPVEFSLSPTNPSVHAGQGIHLTVTRLDHGPSSATVMIDSADGSATGSPTGSIGSDYQSVHETLTFGPGDAPIDIYIPTYITGTGSADDRKTFRVSLSVPTTEVLDPNGSFADVTIVNSPESVALTGSTTFKQNDRNAVINVARSVWDDALVVPYTITAGTAVYGTDFTGSQSGTVAFAPGQEIAQITIPLRDDHLYQPDGATFTVALDSPTTGAATGIPGSKTFSIETTNAPAKIGFAVANTLISQYGETAHVTVTRTGDLYESASVDYATGDGSAVADADYHSVSGTITFDPQQTSKVIDIDILVNTSVASGTNAFSLTLSDISSHALLGDIATSTVSISHGTSLAMQFDSPNYAANEAQGNVMLRVVSTIAVPVPVTLDYQTVQILTGAPSDNAVPGVDYVTKSGTITIAAGQTQGTLSVQVLGLSLPGTPKSFQVSLSDPSAGSLGSTSTATVKIVNPIAPAVIGFSASTVFTTNSASTLKLTVVRTGNLSIAGSVSYTAATATGQTAIAGTDYTSATGTAVFGAGDAYATVEVPILRNASSIADKTFTVQLSNPTSGLSLGGAPSVAVTIGWDNGVTQYQFHTGSYTGMQGAWVELTVDRTGSLADTTHLGWITTSGTAQPLRDYGTLVSTDYTGQYTQGNLLFLPGQTSATIRIPIESTATIWTQFSVVLVDRDPVHNVSQPASFGAISTAVVNIIGNGGPAVIQFSATSFTNEDKLKGDVVIVEVDRSGNTSVAATFYFTDWEAQQRLTFNPGETKKFIAVPYEGDSIFLPVITFPATLSTFPRQNEVIGAIDTTEITIDSRIPYVIDPIGFAKATYLVNEASGYVDVAVSRTGPSDDLGWLNQTSYVSYTTVDGTALAGVDYISKAGILEFDPGETTKMVRVPIIEGRGGNGDTEFTMSLSAVPGEPAPTLSVDKTTIVVSHLTDATKTPYWGSPSTSSDHAYEAFVDSDQAGADGRLSFSFRNGEYADMTSSQLAAAGLNDQAFTVQIYVPLPDSIVGLTAIQDWATQSINLAWTLPDDGGKDGYYRVERSVGGGDFSALATVPVGTTSYVDGTVAANTAYAYRVVAVSGDLEANASNVAYAMLVNHPPKVQDIGTQLIQAGTTDYQYDVEASDAEDGKNLDYSISAADVNGTGASVLAIDPHTGVITQASGWTPTASDVGKVYKVTVNVADQGGLSVSRVFSLAVVAVPATPPTVGDITFAMSADGRSATLSSGAAAGLVYQWQVDPAHGLAGATIVDPADREPRMAFPRAGTYAVILRVSDPSDSRAFTLARGTIAVVQQATNVLIAEDPGNADPSTVSVPARYPGGATPVSIGYSDSHHYFMSTLYDQFGDKMTGDPDDVHPNMNWTLKDPTGGTAASAYDAQTVDMGTTTDTHAGRYALTASSGYGADQLVGSVAITYAAVDAPTFSISDLGAASTGRTLAATSVTYAGNPDALTYTWSVVGHPEIGFADNGTLAGKQTTESFPAAGTYSGLQVQLTVTDPTNGLSTTVTYGQPTVSLTSVPSRLKLTPSHPTIGSGGYVILTASELDQFGAPVSPQPSSVTWTMSGVGSLVDPATGTGTPSGLQGKYSFAGTPSGASSFLADIHVQVGTFAASGSVNFGIQTPPSVSLSIDTTSDTLAGTGGPGGDDTGGSAHTFEGANDLVDQPERVRAIISGGADDVITWVLSAAPRGETGGTVLLNGSGNVGALPNVYAKIGMLSPTQLPDGMYTVTLTVTDDDGGAVSVASSSQDVEIRSAAKLGNMTLPVTDIAQAVPNGPSVTVSRGYDSQRAGQDSPLGYGWTLDSLTPALTTTETVQYDGEPSLPGTPGPAPSLAWNDLVYVTLPGGEEHVFAFQPIAMIDKSNPEAGFVMGIATYVPNFVPVDGTNATLVPYDLSAGDTRSGEVLQWDSESGYMFKSYDNDDGYNPALNEFGGGYLLTTGDGTKYVVNAATGRLVSETNLLGQEQVFSGGTSVDVDDVTYATSTANVPGSSHVQSIATTRSEGGTTTVLQRASYGYDGAGNLVGAIVSGASGGASQKTTYGYADRLLVSYGASLASTTVYATLTRGDGQVWTGTGWTNVASAAQHVALTGIGAGGTGAEWFSGEVPDGVAAGTALTVAYFDGSAQIWTESRQYNGPQEHLLTGVIDGQGVKVLSATYDAKSNQLLSLNNVKGTTANTTTSFSGDAAAQTTTDPSGGQVSNQYDDHGNVVRSIKTITDPTGKIVQSYQVTVSDVRYADPGVTLDGETTLVIDGETHTFDIDVPLANTLLSYDTSTTFSVPASRASDRFLSTDQLVAAGYLKTDGQGQVLWATKRSYHLDAGNYGAGDDRQLFTSMTLSSDGTYVTNIYTGYVDDKPTHVATQGPGIGDDRYSYYSPADAQLPGGDPDPNVGVLTRTHDDATGIDTYYLYGGQAIPGTGDYDWDGDYIPLAYAPGAVGSLYATYQTLKSDNTPDFLSTNAYYASTTATATTPGGVKGMLESSTDLTANGGAGVTTRYLYNPDGTTAAVYGDWTDADGTHDVLQGGTTFDGLRRATVTTDADGNQSTTTYDANGKPVDSTDIYGGVTHSVYDASGNLVQTIYPDGTETRTVYDGQGRAVWQTDRYASSTTYDATTHAVAEDNLTPANGTRTIYDIAGDVVGTERHQNVLVTLGADVTAGVGGMVISQLSSSGTLASSTSTIYDGRGRAVETIDAAGLRAGTIYYDNGQVRYSGILNASASDKGTSPWWTVSLPVDDDSHTHVLEDYLSGLFASYAGYVYGQVDGHGYAFGSWVSYDMTTDALGNWVQTFKDHRGDVTETLYSDGSYVQTMDGNPGQVLGKPEGWDDGLDGQWTVSSDEGWTWRTDPEDPESGMALPAGYTEKVDVAQRKPDADGHHDSVQATISVYDPRGRLVDVWEPAVTDGDPASRTYGEKVRPHWHYEYDANGNETSQTDPNGNTTTWTYDDEGRQTDHALPGGDAEHWTYDSFDRQATHTDFDGNVTAEVYDDSPAGGGRMLTEYRFAAGATVFSGTTLLPNNATERTAYSYDALGRATLVTDCSHTPGTTTWATSTYTSTTYDPSTGDTASVATPQGTVTYAYDSKTGQHTETSTSNNDTAYLYDAQGRLTTVSVVKLNGVTLSAPQVTTYAYDLNGNLVTETQPSGVTSTYTYDGLNRLTTEVATGSTGTVVAEYDYHLTSAGLRDSVLEHQAGTNAGTFSTVKVTYGYDADGRLASEFRDVGNDSTTGAPNNAGDYTNAFVYDLNGNRVSQAHDETGTTNDVVTTSAYDARDELTSQTATASGGSPAVTAYTYDDNGSQLTAGSDATTWDLRGRMATDTVAGVTTTYAYDTGGTRTDETTGANTTTFLNDGLNPTGYVRPVEEKVNGTLSRSYVIGLKVEAVRDTVGTAYQLTDGHGSTRALFAAGATSGAPQARFDYDAFGSSIGFDAASARTEWLFGSGGIYDAPSGTYIAGVRPYLPSTGRWMRADPRGQISGDMPNANLYSFVGSNPLSLIDPTGRSGLGELLAVTGIDTMLSNMELASFQAVFATVRGVEAGEDANQIFEGFLLDQAIQVGAMIGLNLVGGLFSGLLDGSLFAAREVESELMGEVSLECVSGNYCFAPGTELLVPGKDGAVEFKAIDKFAIGDRIVTRDEHDHLGEVVISTVEDVFVRTSPILTIKIAGRDIDTTPGHPFYVKGKGWTKAVEIGVGDLLSSHDGSWNAIESIVDSGKISEVYNLKVARCHTYFVGSRQWKFSVWAHNTYLSEYSDAEMRDWIAGEREALAIGEDRTVMVSDYEISTLPREGPTTTHSGDFTAPGATPLPEDRVFETQFVNHDRAYDAEVKYLEHMAKRLDAAGGVPQGTIVMRINAPGGEVCPSCKGVINQFQLRYPQVRVEFRTV